MAVILYAIMLCTVYKYNIWCYRLLLFAHIHRPELVLCQYLVQPKMKISPLHQLASDLEYLQRALYNRSNSSGERKLQWLCVLTVL